MSKARLEMGMSFSTRSSQDKKRAPTNRNENTYPLHILLMGNFSGRKIEKKSDEYLKIREIDRDNFEETFASLKVSVYLANLNLDIAFDDTEDFHPDTLHEKVTLFSNLKKLRKKLLTPSSFNEAAHEILGWTEFNQREDEVDNEPAKNEIDSDSEKLDSDNLLDSILSNSHSVAAPADNSGVNQIIKNIVAPYVTHKDPRQETFLAAIDAAKSDLMRSILQDPSFKALESSWRALELLVRRIETHSNLKLFILDSDKESLARSLCEPEAGAHADFYQKIVEANRIPGAHHFSIIQGDYYIKDSLEDIQLIDELSQVAEEIQATLLLGCSSNYADDQDLTFNSDSIDRFSDEWNQLRNKEECARVGLAAPRYLQRLPYGQENNTIESFSFEEIVDVKNPQAFLWGNSAYLLTLLLAQSFAEYQWEFNPGDVSEIQDMPLYIAKLQGITEAMPNSEVYISEGVLRTMQSAGVVALSSVKGSTSIVARNWNSLKPDVMLQGRWKS